MKLHVVVEEDESGYFAAEVPALPGCLSQGKTREEAIANVKEAIEGWLEVMEAKQAIDTQRTMRLSSDGHPSLPWHSSHFLGGLGLAYVLYRPLPSLVEKPSVPQEILGSGPVPSFVGRQSRETK